MTLYKISPNPNLRFFISKEVPFGIGWSTVSSAATQDEAKQFIRDKIQHEKDLERHMKIPDMIIDTEGGSF